MKLCVTRANGSVAGLKYGISVNNGQCAGPLSIRRVDWLVHSCSREW